MATLPRLGQRRWRSPIAGLIALSLSAAALIAVLFAVDLVHERRRTFEEAEISSDATVRLLAGYLADRLGAVEGMLASTSTAPGAPDTIAALASSVGPFVRAVYLADRDGRVVPRFGTAPSHARLPAAPSLPATRPEGQGDGLALGLPEQTPEGWMLRVARPLRGGDGLVAGAAVAELDFDRLLGAFDGAIGRRPQKLSIVRQDGFLVARSPADGARLGRRIERPEALAALAAGGISGSIEGLCPVDLTPRIGTWRRVPGLPLIVLAGTDRSAVLAPWRLHLGMSLVAVTVALGSLGLLTRLLVRQFRQLQHGEARLRAAIDASMDEFFVLEAMRGPDRQIVDFRFSDLNPKGEAAFGAARADLLCAPLSTFLPAAQFEALRGKYAGVVETGEPLEEEFVLEPRPGVREWIRHQVVRLGHGVAVTRRNVTDRHVAEERIDLAEAQLAEISAAIPGAVVQYRLEPDRSFRFTYASASLEQLFGIPRATLAADPGMLMALVLPEDREPVRAALRRSARELAPFKCDYRIRTARGIRWIRVDALPHRLEHGAVVWNGVLSDCTTEKQREDELRLARREAEAASRTKSAFLANMSHELRTPLNAIIGFSDTLRAGYFGGLSEKQKEYLRDIGHAGMHLLGIINDVLDVSKIEAGKERLHEREVPLGAVIAAAATLVRGNAREKGIRLELPELGSMPTLRADELKLKQILVNLLSNAVKFTPPHGLVTAHVEWLAGESVAIAVTDNGVGIAPEDLPKVMEPFWQAEPSYARRAGGTGLGLALVRHLAQMHGGSVDIASRLGHGTTVTVTLPPERVVRSAVQQSHAR